MTRQLSVYLAGPSVFYPDAARIATRLRQLCTNVRLLGRYPLDNLLMADRQGCTKQELASRIGHSNEELIRMSDAVVADYTPFRGLAMDTGTAFEIGFARALQLPVIGYSDSRLSYFERVVQSDPGYTHRADGEPIDSNGLMIEDFGYADNIMLCHNIEVLPTAEQAIARAVEILRAPAI